MDYKYNELDYAEIIYHQGFQSTYITTELKLLSVYLRRILDYKPKKLKEEIYKWCELNIPDFSKEKYYKLINSAIAHGVKKGSCLIKIDSIPIYLYELLYISNYSNLDYQCRKLMFTLLVQSKLYRELSVQRGNKITDGKYFSGGRRRYHDLKKAADIKPATRLHEDLIYQMSINNVITPAFNGMIFLNFIEGIQNKSNEIAKSQGNQQENNPAILLKNFNHIGRYYDYYCGQPKMAICKSCGQPFVKRSNNQTSCNKDCGKELDKINARNRMNNIRSNQNNLSIP